MYVLTDCRISAQAADALRAYGHSPLPCLPHPALDPAVASHPDMLFFPCKSGIFALGGHDACAGRIPTIPILQAPARKYPRDVLLNAARIGNYLVCRPDTTAHEVIRQAHNEKLTILPVRQGYTKCNLCVVSEQAAITEDKAIAQALQSVGIDVLLLQVGGVSLPGYAYGFIGGASGCDDRHVFFCGNLALHPEGERITAFCQKHGKSAVSLAEHPLHDVGSLLFLP